MLAAGLSRRMGKNKLLLKLGNKTIIQKTLDNILASRVTGITVVLGHMKEELAETLAGYKVSLVENACYPEGMSTSIQAGVRKMIGIEEKDAMMIFNGDMPFIKPVTINSIIKEYLKQESAIVVPCHGGKRGHPVLFDRRLFAELLGISGDIGAREIIQKYYRQVVCLDVDDPGIHQDIDCPDDYAEVLSL